MFLCRFKVSENFVHRALYRQLAYISKHIIQRHLATTAIQLQRHCSFEHNNRIELASSWHEIEMC